MKIGRARILLAGASPVAELLAPDSGRPRSPAHASRGARRVPAIEVDAAARARELVTRAEREAEAILNRAERDAAQARLQAETEGRADAVATLAARAIALRAHESETTERQLDQLLALARVLAERVLGEELRLNPERVTDLARQALREARGARQIVIEAHPEDVPVLERALETLAPHAHVRIVSSEARPRSNLRIVTDVGVLDADLSPQLERLTQKLRETLKHD